MSKQVSQIHVQDLTDVGGLQEVHILYTIALNIKTGTTDPQGGGDDGRGIIHKNYYVHFN